jgi:hypothetical protein
MMGRYRLDQPGLIYAHSGNENFWQIHLTTYQFLMTGQIR